MIKRILYILFFLSLISYSYAVDVRPNYHGFGGSWSPYDATYDPEICIVTDLTCDGGARGSSTRNGVSVKTGDFRSCFEEQTANGPDNQGVIILFETSGTIDCTGGDLRPTNQYTYIAAASAPIPGVMIKGETFLIYQDYQYYSHLRIRTGDQQASDEDGYKRNVMEVEADNLVLDHCSLSWSLDGIFGVGDYEYPSEDADNIDLYYCILAEALRNPRVYNSSYENHCGANCTSADPPTEPSGSCESYPTNPRDNCLDPNCDPVTTATSCNSGPCECSEPDHSTAILAAYGTLDFSMIGNLIAHSERRNPSIEGETVRAYIANNIVYNWKNGTMAIGSAAALTAIGNLYIRGDDTWSGAERNPLVSTKDDGDWYALDNEQICDGACPEVTQWYGTGDDPCGLTGDNNQTRLYFDIDGYVGYHTSATPSSTVVTDTDGFSGGITGQVIQNLTDNSKCTITGSTGTTATCSGGLSGGSDNTWQQYDDYIIGTERRCTKEIDVASYSPISVVSDGGAQLKIHIFRNTGAWPVHRDEVDEEILADFIEGTGNTINSEMSRGSGRQVGWQSLAVNTHSFDSGDLQMPSNFHTAAPSGWTYGEEWLHRFLDKAENRHGRFTVF